jgi:hypothetical protein
VRSLSHATLPNFPLGDQGARRMRRRAPDARWVAHAGRRSGTGTARGLAAVLGRPRPAACRWRPGLLATNVRNRRTGACLNKGRVQRLKSCRSTRPIGRYALSPSLVRVNLLVDQAAQFGCKCGTCSGARTAVRLVLRQVPLRRHHGGSDQGECALETTRNCQSLRLIRPRQSAGRRLDGGSIDIE